MTKLSTPNYFERNLVIMHIGNVVVGFISNDNILLRLQAIRSQQLSNFKENIAMHVKITKIVNNI